MSKTVVPQGYKPATDLYETQRAISAIKDIFQKKLSDALNLTRVSAPLFVEAGTEMCIRDSHYIVCPKHERK